MTTHPRDLRSDNPRIQCVVCGEWKRLHLREERGGLKQTFYGGCIYADGGDHLARRGDGPTADNDVCEDCCHIACKAIAQRKAGTP